MGDRDGDCEPWAVVSVGLGGGALGTGFCGGRWAGSGSAWTGVAPEVGSRGERGRGDGISRA